MRELSAVIAVLNEVAMRAPVVIEKGASAERQLMPSSALSCGTNPQYELLLISTPLPVSA
jgi:hypothetical protein